MLQSGLMVKLGVFFAILILGSSALAADCFRSEINPKTRKIYSSEKIYLNDIEKWQAKMPESPGLPALTQAYSIYSKEKALADSFKNDKKAHCYVGCRISQEVSFKVAEYVGWFKEAQDIRDCNKRTHFDVADFVATFKGAQVGQSVVEAKGCLNSCP